MAYLEGVIQCQLCLVLPLGKRRAHNWHSSNNAESAICASPRVIPMTHRSLITSWILSENCIFGSCQTMPIMPGITLGEAQSAHLAFIRQCHICNLCFPKGNTDDTPVLNNVLYPEWKLHIWQSSYNANYAWYYPWGNADCISGIVWWMPNVRSVLPQG